MSTSLRSNLQQHFKGAIEQSTKLLRTLCIVKSCEFFYLKKQLFVASHGSVFVSQAFFDRGAILMVYPHFKKVGGFLQFYM